MRASLSMQPGLHPRHRARRLRADVLNLNENQHGRSGVGGSTWGFSSHPMHPEPARRMSRFLRLAPWGAAVALLLAAPLGANSPELPLLPLPQDLPAPALATDAPYEPQTILPGGVVVPLYPPDSPYLNAARINEAEVYKSYNPPFLGYIVNIHNPSIEFHAGNGEVNTGTVVIIAPGGGHNVLNLVGEGADVVPYFTRRGISAVILRNRLRSDGYEPGTDGVHDLQQAVKLVRAHAADWNLDPNKIGVLGFSAGAELCAGAALEYEAFDAANDTADNPLAKVSSRPDFVGLVYPGPSPFAFGGEAAIPRDAPPAFFTGAGWGDWIHALWATEYFTALLNDGVPNVELHIYARGVHPGDRGKSGQPPATAGISSRGGVAFGAWQERYMDWLGDLGFTGKPGEITRAALDIAANLDRESPYAALQARMRARQAEQAAAAAAPK